MLSQSESVVVDFFAKPATIFANFVLDFGKLRLGFLSYLYHIELSWNVTCQKKEEKFALDVLVFATIEPKCRFEVAFDIFSTLPIFCGYLGNIP
jgi:hypothetical protein